MIELLVVMAIIGLLLALMMTAVQAARESARRLDCKSRLRQIALGLNHYHHARKSFPPGIEIRKEGVCLEGKSREGKNWAIFILPFLEEQPASAQYRDDLYNESPENEGTRTTFVSIYSCPGDEWIGQRIAPSAGPIAPVATPKLLYSVGSYRGVSGFSKGDYFLDNEAHANLYSSNHRGVLHAVIEGSARLTPEPIKKITDGTSWTVMIGESISRSNPGMHTLWAYSYRYYSLSAVTIEERTLWGDYDRCALAASQTGKAPCQRSWGSNHPNQLNFAFVDGSVRSIATTIDLEPLAQMATIAGQELPTQSD
ncbi:MAG: DUF1559 domain-containing protein [Pirellulales bacterium]|nr:DUF1559 domain-containing protein [Pirellulales bacterium]